MLGFDEGGGFREVVDDEGGLRVAVVHGCQGGEAFLPGGVPDFEFDGAGWEGAFLGEEGGCLGGKGTVSGGLGKGEGRF